MEKLNFSKDGSIHCKACLSGLTGSDGSDSVVKNLNDRQEVTTYGERGYATFSERGGMKKLFDRATPSSPKLYLNSHGDGTGGWAAYGRGRQKTKVENGKSTKATIPLVNW